MSEQYDPKTFFKFLGYAPAADEYSCPGLRTINVYCRGDRAQLEQMVSLTPLKLESDIFIVTVADFSNVTNSPYMDAGVVLAVSYGDQKAGNYFFEFEDQHWSCAAGRELWGYPKRYTKISLDKNDEGAQGKVRDYDTSIIEIGVEFDDSVTNDAWSEAKFAPTIQVRGVPQLRGDSFDSLDVIMRDTAHNFKVTERRLGKGSVELGPVDTGSGLLGGEPLKILEVLGAEYVVGDFASTTEYGAPVTLASLA